MACELSIQYAALIAGLYSANAITLPLLQGLMGKQPLAWGAGQRHSPTGASPLGDTTIRRACPCPRWTKTEETSPQSHLDLGGKEGTAQTARMTPTILANGRDRLLFAIFGCSLFALADLSLDTISCTIQPQECSHFLTALNLDHSAWEK